MQAKSASDVKFIDVSHHQGTINWTKVAASGVKGAIIKASEGLTNVDSAFKTNVAGATKAGLPISFYHYAHPELNDPLKEAAHFYEVIKGLPHTFPVALDCEGSASKIGATALTAWCVKFLHEIERLTGTPAMIYTGASFARSYLGKALAPWPIWVAHYGTNDPMDNTTWNTWAIFQFADNGKVDGIAGNVDVDAVEKSFYDKYVNPVPPAQVPVPVPDTKLPLVTVNIDGKLFTKTAVLDGGSTFVPARLVGEALGVKIGFANGKVTVNGLSATTEIIGNIGYVAVRTIITAAGASFTWDGKTLTVNIITKK